MNMPIWLPTVRSIDSSDSSGARTSRLKNSITLWTSPRRSTGKPNAACRPSRAATAARGKLRSWTTSGIQAGSPVDQTRPGKPTPGAKVAPRLIASNSGNSHRWRRPDLGTPQDVGPAVDRPERAVLPAERLADAFEDFRRGFVDAGRLEQRSRRHVFGRQATGAPIRVRRASKAATS